MNDYTKDAAQPQKLAFQSVIPAAEKRRHLKQLFPKAFVETQNQQGQTIKTIYLERIQAALGQFSEVQSQREASDTD